MRVEVRVSPRSSRSEIVELGANRYKVYMHAPAVDGKANRKLAEMLAEYFGTKKNRVKIVSGLKAKNKVVEIGL